MKLLTALHHKAATQATMRFVPQSEPVLQRDVARLQQFISHSDRLFVLTGAGLSTESGIPDYRSDKVGLYSRSSHRPMQYQEFVKSAAGRQRYWARNFVGWPKFSSFQPNIAHDTLSRWEETGKVSWLVTQNVDALHSKAGSTSVTELHGCSHRVHCLSCDLAMTRWQLQTLFEEHNDGWHAESMTHQLAPDGDVLLSQNQVQSFKVPDCPECGGILKPDVIFFGDNVPKATVDNVFDKLSRSDSVLVAGSSLFVYSGYRFVRRAAEEHKNIAIINIGETRADSFVNLKIHAKCGDILPKIDVAITS